MFRFVRTLYIGIRILLTPDAVAPQIGVLYIGDLLILPSGIPVGHTPICYGNEVEKTNQVAYNGDFLGTVIRAERLRSSINQQKIDPETYRTYVEPFRQAAILGTPFFLSWAPQWYPDEVGFCWVEGNPQPVISENSGLIDLSFDVEALSI